MANLQFGSFVDPKTSDKSQRRYAAGIERSLSLFDAARLEWPDYISFLGRLLKVLTQKCKEVCSCADCMPGYSITLWASDVSTT